MPTSYLLATALLESGWEHNVRLDIDAQGRIAALDGAGSDAGAVRLEGAAVPGMPNLHSHAFQRALAGLVEEFSGTADNFWSWRRAMYRLVARVTPEQLQAIAAQLYLEMLKSGYTAVAEFHYLHHDPAGRGYSNPALMSEALVAAARDTGIGMTLLPVLYMSPGFGGGTLEESQRRFAFSRVGDYLDLVADLRRHCDADPQIGVGIAPHSLRAVPLEALHEVVNGATAMDATAPIHIHVAEQQREVDDCLTYCGRRPVQLLLDQLPLDARWCLVHATHMEAGEISALATSGATAGLCPSTEANLGDGLFPLRDWHAAGGKLGIGSDSNTSVSPVEELRWLEYGQRLALQQRNIFAGRAHPHVGANLWREACRGGASALGRDCGALRVGARADFLVLDTDHPCLHARSADPLLDSLVFSGNSSLVAQVFSGGEWLVRDGAHARETEIGAAFNSTLRELFF